MRVFMRRRNHGSSGLCGRVWTAAAGFSLALASVPGAAAPTLPGDLKTPFADSEDCAECHSFANSAETKDQPLVSPIAWQGTLMANAARDPVFWAGVAIASQDQQEPDETVICVRCHSPQAFVGGRGGSIAIDELDPLDRDGIGCDFCHRMIDDGVTAAGNAQYVIDDVPALDGKIPKRGPWGYEMGEQPLHSWLVDEPLGASRTCGTCHDVTTPRERVDARGEPMGALFNEQRTYSEWLGSAYAPGGDEPKSCQDCHMPAVADVAGCGKNASEGVLHASGGRRHDLAGGNRFMIDVLRQLYGDSGTAEVKDVFFTIAADNIDATLATAASLEVVVPEAVDLAVGIADLAITVTNQTGHKLPTGYSEGRVMWIEVTASYGDELVYSSGRWLDGEGPEDDPQVRRYEAIAINYADKQEFHLLRNDHWVVDSRIPPRGLMPDPETDPVGDRYSLDDQGKWPHSDTVNYVFPPTSVMDQTPLDPGDDLLELRVRLLYLVNSPEYLEFLADANITNSAGALAFDVFAELGGVQPSVLAEQVISLPLSGLVGAMPETTGGESSSGSSSAGSSGGNGSTSGGNSSSSGSGNGVTSASAGATGDDSGEEGGCGCRSSGEGPPIPGWLGLGLGLGLLLRRRRGRAWARSREPRQANGGASLFAFRVSRFDLPGEGRKANRTNPANPATAQQTLQRGIYPRTQLGQPGDRT